MLARAYSDNERTSSDRRDETMWITRRDRSEGVGSFENHDRVPDRVEQVTALPKIVVYPVSNHLRVGLGIEPVSALEELRPNGGVILDDSVVDDGHFISANERVCIRLGRLPVRGPPGMGDAGAPVRPIPLDDRL